MWFAEVTENFMTTPGSTSAQLLGYIMKANLLMISAEHKSLHTRSHLNRHPSKDERRNMSAVQYRLRYSSKKKTKKPKRSGVSEQIALWWIDKWAVFVFVVVVGDLRCRAARESCKESILGCRCSRDWGLLRSLRWAGVFPFSNKRCCRLFLQRGAVGYRGCRN